MKTQTGLALLVALGTMSVHAQQAPAIRYEPSTFEVAGIGTVTAEIGRFEVLEDRTRPDGRRIELAFGRLRSTAERPGAPIVYLDGGPGGSGIGMARVPDYYRLFDRLRAIGDVILLSQRGTGFSSPRLVCPSKAPVPPDIFSSADAMAAALLPATLSCVEQWRARADLAAYNTNASADDLDDLRRALGAARLNLLGFSYGTHLGLAAIRRHGATLDRVVLAGTEGPDDSQKLPHVYDLQLARIAALEAASPSAPQPGLVDVTHALFDRLRSSPVDIEWQPEKDDAATRIRLHIGLEGFQYLLRRDLGDTNDTANVIRLIRDTARGDYQVLTRFAARRYGEFGGGVSLMGTAMDCASGVSPERLAQIRREIPDGLLGRMTNFPFPEICSELGLQALPEFYRSPIVSRVPVLFISGTLDSNTPPYQAEEVRWGFPNSVHLIIDRAGHESTLPLPEVQQAIVDFFGGADVSGRRLSAPDPLAGR